MRTIKNWAWGLADWVKGLVAWLFAPERRIQSVVLLMSIVTVLLAAAQSAQNQYVAAQEHDAAQHLQRVIACQVRYNETISRITKFRSQLADQDRAAVKTLNRGTSDFIFGVVTPTPNLSQQEKVARFLKLTNTYRHVAEVYSQTEAQIDAQRAEHPLPALPPASCR